LHRPGTAVRGAGKRRILYQNTCDAALGLTTAHCQDQDGPHLIVQNLTFADGNSTGQRTGGGGGGAIFVRGGRLSVVNSRFVRNRCDDAGPDLGGAAIRVLSQPADAGRRQRRRGLRRRQRVHRVDRRLGAPGQSGERGRRGVVLRQQRPDGHPPDP
jgi:hypothetical protein